MKFKSRFSALLAVATLLLLALNANAQTARGSGQRISGSGISLTTSGSSGASTLTGSVLNIPVYSSGSSGITALTGDVTATGPGSAAASVVEIQGIAVGTPTGTGNVVFSASPTFTGTITGAAANFSGALSALSLTATTITGVNAALSGTTTIATAQIAAGNATLTNLTATTVTGTTGNFPTLNFTNALGTTITATNYNATGTVKGFPFPEIQLRATTTDTTGDITPGNYTPAAGTNSIIGIPGYSLLGGVSSGIAVLTLTGMLPPVIPQGTLYLRQRYLTLSALTSGTVKATVSDAVVTNSGNPFTASLNAETQTSLGATTTDTFLTVDTALTSTATANGVAVVNYQLNQTSTANDWVAFSLVIK